MTKYLDFASLQIAIEAGEEEPLPPLDIDMGDPYYTSLNHEIDRFGPKGKRQVRTCRGLHLMIEAKRGVLINEWYKDVYSFTL